MSYPRPMTDIANPAFRYHGGKWRLAPWVISHFAPHKTYVEPYGGAASVLIQKPRSAAEVYNDIDGDVVNFFRVLQDAYARTCLIDKLMYTPYARDEFFLAFEECLDPVERARRLLIRAEMGFGSAGATKGRTGFRRETLRRPHRPGSERSVQGLWAKKWKQIDLLADRFQGVLVENRPALDVIDRYDSAGTLFYVDPPYIPELRVMRSTSRYYRYEMNADEHRELCEKLTSAKGMVLLGGYRSGLYERILSGWKMIDRSVSISGNRGGSTRVECLWINPAAAVNGELNGL